MQDSPVYGSERRGAPVSAFTRISDGEILERGFIFEPDMVIVMDDTLLTDFVARPLEGLRSGGIEFVNAPQALQKMTGGRSDVKLVAQDLTTRVIQTLGKPLLSVVSACVAARLVSVISEDAMLSAVESELEDLGVKEELLGPNLQLAKWAYHSMEPQKLDTTELPSERTLVPLEVVVTGEGRQDILAVGNSKLRRTGNWRIFRPTIDYGKCTTCMICFAYCPESAIILGEDKKLAIDYENCKGCLICYKECPPKAITFEREVKGM